MSQEYVAKSVRPGKVYDRNEHGAVLQAFYVDFQGPDGKVEQGCYWRRKQGNDPEVGQTYVGDIEEGQFGPRFKQAKGGGSSDYAPRSNGSKKGREWKPEAQYDPEKVARISRAHAQGMAVQVAVGAGYFKGEVITKKLDDDLTPLIDWFQADVDKAATAAGASRIPKSATSQAPAASQPPDAHGFSHYLEEGGVNAAAATLLTNWVLSGDLEDGSLTASEQDAALDALRDPEKRSKAIERLRERYTAANGELPEAESYDESQIPF